MSRPLIRWALATSLLLAGARTQAAVTMTLGNPSKLEVKLFKTEVIPVAVAGDGSFTVGTPVVVFDAGSAGAVVDLVANAGGLFGQGDVAVGRYDRIRLTIENTVSFSTGAIGACVPTAAQSLLVDSIRGGADPVPLTFATPATGGGAGWYANGSDANPLLMSAPVVVEEAQTTRVSFQFDTQDSVQCNGGVVSMPSAPNMRVESTVVPPGSPFAGGDYWIGHYNSTNGFWSNGGYLGTCGVDCDPYSAAGTALDRANYRRSFGFNLGWGGAVSFSAADSAGQGSLTGGGIPENRRKVDETGCTFPDCGVNPNPSAFTIDFSYSMDADHRFTILNDSQVMYGGFNEDFSVFVGVGIETSGGRPTGADLIVGVRKSGAQELSGVYGLNMAGTEMTYPIVGGVQQPVMKELYFNNVFGWASFDDGTPTYDAMLYGAFFNFFNPAGTPTTPAPGDFRLSHGSKDMRANGMFGPSMSIDASGAGTLNFGGIMDLWLAADAGGHSVLLAGDTGTTNSYSGDQATASRLEQTYGIMLKQAPAGTHTLASLSGSWVWASRVDELKEVVPDVDAIVSKRAEWGTMTTDAVGIATLDINSMDDTGVVSGVTKVGDLTVYSVCVGTSADDGVGRLDWTLSEGDCAAASGRMMDIGVLTALGADGRVGTEAWFMFNDNGSTASIVSPDGFDERDVTRTNHHMLGYALRTAR